MINSDNNFYEGLLKYFQNTTEDKIKADWDKSKKADEVGPTVEEFLSYQVPYCASDQ